MKIKVRKYACILKNQIKIYIKVKIKEYINKKLR